MDKIVYKSENEFFIHKNECIDEIWVDDFT